MFVSKGSYDMPSEFVQVKVASLNNNLANSLTTVYSLSDIGFNAPTLFAPQTITAMPT